MFKKKMMKIDAFKPLKLMISFYPDLDPDPDLTPDLTRGLYGNKGRIQVWRSEHFKFRTSHASIFEFFFLISLEFQVKSKF